MKYSVTIPAYKSKFLKECIDSILAQTFEDYEIVIVNDASPENLDSIVNQYTDSRIRYYVNEKNCGAIDVVDNWNKCLQYAQGDYIICMGDDDMLAPNCLEEYDALMVKYPNLDVYHIRTKIIDENSEFIGLIEDRPEYESVYSILWHTGRKTFIGDYLYKRESLIKNGGFYKLPLAWLSDCITLYIASSKTGIANSHSLGFYYRNNGQTITSQGNERIKLYAYAAYCKWIDEFLQNEPNDVLDKYYWKLIIERRKDHFPKTKVLMLANEIKNHPKSLIYWFHHYKEIDISYKHYVVSCVLSILLFLYKK